MSARRGGVVTPPPPQARPTPATRPRRKLRQRISRTPGRMTTIGLGTVLGLVACGYLGYLGGSTQAAALERARADVRQLAIVHDVRNDLVAADSTAASGLLVTGTAAADYRSAYNTSIAAAATSLPHLAATHPANADALGAVSADLVRYASMMEQAQQIDAQRDVPRTEQMREASTILYDDIVPRLDRLARANADQATEEFATAEHAADFVTGGLLLLFPLAAGQIWLARRTHRVLNLGVAGATALVLVAGVICSSSLHSAAETTMAVRTGPYAGNLALTEAFALAVEAKAMESLALVEPGSAHDYDSLVESRISAATTRIDDAKDAGVMTSDSLLQLTQWVAHHQEIRDLENAGDHTGAVARAISPDPGSATAAFRAFAQSTSINIEALADQTDAQLSDAASQVRTAGWSILLASLAGAVLAWTGIRRRLKEYR